MLRSGGLAGGRELAAGSGGSEESRASDGDGSPRTDEPHAPFGATLTAQPSRYIFTRSRALVSFSESWAVELADLLFTPYTTENLPCPIISVMSKASSNASLESMSATSERPTHSASTNGSDAMPALVAPRQLCASARWQSGVEEAERSLRQGATTTRNRRTTVSIASLETPTHSTLRYEGPCTACSHHACVQLRDA